MQLPVTLVVDLPSPVLAVLDHLSQQNADIIRRLAAIERAVTANTITDIITTEALMADFTELHDEIAANGDAVDSAVTLLENLSAQLTDAADDPAEIRSIAAELSSNSTRLAEAVTANTPAAPEAPVNEPAPEV
jgi:hypothetical protein